MDKTPNQIVQMPKYKSHKTISALKIDSMISGEGRVYLDFLEYGRLSLVAEEEDTIRIVTAIGRHAAETGENDNGYYVVYEDGYKSWSPTKAFEEGYTKM